MSATTKRMILIALLAIGFAGSLFALHGLLRIAAVLILIVLSVRLLAPIYFARKMTEWDNDLKHLGLWLKLAFKPNREPHETAAMAHQQQFLDGRMLSPLNVFAALPMWLAVGGIAFGSITGIVSHFRIEHLKAERDASCSRAETTPDSHGHFHTSRHACADLGTTIQTAVEWRTTALGMVAERDRAIHSIREESDHQVALAQQRARETQALAARTRRRENEGIAAYAGGPAPDFERSLCELAGRVACVAPNGDPGASAIAPAGSVPAAPGGASGSGPATAPTGSAAPAQPAGGNPAVVSGSTRPL